MKIDLKGRQKARHFAIQALYQWKMSGETIADIEQQFLLSFENKRVDAAYFQELLKSIITHLDELDSLFEPHLNIPLQDIDVIELAILRLATNELKFCLEIPYRVVINEALELAKTFGSVDGFKFINGVLDKTAKDLRALEME